MKSSAHIGFWLVMALVATLCAPVLTSANDIYARLQAERTLLVQVFGPRVASWAIHTADAAHGVVAGTGLVKALEQGVHDEKDMRNAVANLSFVGGVLAEVGSAFLAGVLMQMYSVLLRTVIVLMWAAVLLPFMAAAIYDGMMQRAVKNATFGFQNPTAFSLGSHVLILMGVLPLIYIVLPWSVTPLFMPMWALIAALPMSFMITHMQPIFTK